MIVGDPIINPGSTGGINRSYSFLTQAQKAEVVLAILCKDLTNRAVSIDDRVDDDIDEVDVDYDEAHWINIAIPLNWSFSQIVDGLYDQLATCRGRQLR